MAFLIRKKRQLYLALACTLNILVFTFNLCTIVNFYQTQPPTPIIQKQKPSPAPPQLKCSHHNIENKTGNRSSSIINSTHHHKINYKYNRTGNEAYPTIHPDMFEIKIWPWNACAHLHGANLELFVFVISKCSSFNTRNMIRSSWANRREFEKLNVLFVLGTSQFEMVNKEIEAEAKTHGDILQGDFIDSYRNLSFKSLAAWSWTSENCMSSRHFLKVDDDVLVNTYGLLRFLNMNTIIRKFEYTFMCLVFRNGEVIRDRRSKYYMPYNQYSESTYFTYCSGNAILLTGDLIESMYQVAHTSRSIWIDDLYSGLLASQIEDVQFVNIDEMILTSFEYEQQKFGNISKYLFVRSLDDKSLFMNVWQVIQQEYLGRGRAAVTYATKFKMTAFGYSNE
jgi:hypothetical protein